MKLLYIIFIGFFAGICIAEERENPSNLNAVWEDSECDSCLTKAHHVPPVFPQPPIHIPYPPHTHFPSTCGYGASPICHTVNGNFCNSFIINYPVMNNWLSSCIQIWPFFRSCTQFSGPGATAPVLSSGCHFSGTPCLCSFFGYYEAGNIL